MCRTTAIVAPPPSLSKASVSAGGLEGSREELCRAREARRRESSGGVTRKRDPLPTVPRRRSARRGRARAMDDGEAWMPAAGRARAGFLPPEAREHVLASRARCRSRCPRPEHGSRPRADAQPHLTAGLRCSGARSRRLAATWPSAGSPETSTARARWRSRFPSAKRGANRRAPRARPRRRGRAASFRAGGPAARPRELREVVEERRGGGSPRAWSEVRGLVLEHAVLGGLDPRAGRHRRAELVGQVGDGLLCGAPPRAEVSARQLSAWPTAHPVWRRRPVDARGEVAALDPLGGEA